MMILYYYSNTLINFCEKFVTTYGDNFHSMYRDLKFLYRPSRNAGAPQGSLCNFALKSMKDVGSSV